MTFTTILAVMPFMARVFGYDPAPGQYINEAPEIEPDATAAEVIALAEEQLCGSKTPGMVSLGAFGGTLTFGFDHPVVNVPGLPDFAIYGNAITNGPEPGIVEVSQDTNGNGLPDDEWFELIGSLEGDPGTLCNYTVTYYPPEAEGRTQKHSDWAFVTDAGYIRWEDSEGESGWLMHTTFHDQSYWPAWVDRIPLTFTGTRLKSLGVSKSEQGLLWEAEAPEWGYADSRPNRDEIWFNLDNAVNSRREPVTLSYADFFRVHTATNEFRGWLGEASTEISGAEDLHPEAVASVLTATGNEAVVRVQGKSLVIVAQCAASYRVIGANGRCLLEGQAAEGFNSIDLGFLPRGIYLAECGKVVKFVI